MDVYSFIWKEVLASSTDHKEIYGSKYIKVRGLLLTNEKCTEGQL